MEFVKTLKNYLMVSDRIVVFTGAGLSTSSGIPDYRGPKGVWKKRKPVFYQDFMDNENKRIEYWKQKSEDWNMFGNAQPNAAHKAIVDLEKAGKLSLCITQNVDGLHALAGTNAKFLVELHGTNRLAECQSCHHVQVAAPLYEQCLISPCSPLCICGGYLKPATISFGQSLRESDLQRAQDAIMNANLVIALGTTLSVQPAATLPLWAAQQGIPYVIINSGPTAHDDMEIVSLRLDGDVSEVFPEAVAAALFGIES